jgi:hypothetical protein
MKFESFRPWSIFLFRTETNDNMASEFDYVDHAELLTIGMRMSDIGVIAALQDNGAIADGWSPLAKRLRQEPVSPIQFREAFARVTYAASLMNRTPKYITAFGKSITTMSMPLQGLSTKSLFDNWKPAEYSKYMSSYCQVPLDECYQADRGQLTFLGKIAARGSLKTSLVPKR